MEKDYFVPVLMRSNRCIDENRLLSALTNLLKCVCTKATIACAAGYDTAGVKGESMKTTASLWAFIIITRGDEKPFLSLLR